MTNNRQTIIPQEWLYNPVVYSQISGDFSLMQQRVLAGVLGQMQDRILYAINEKEKNKKFPLLFPEDAMQEVLEVDIDPRQLGITPDHYGDLEDALCGMSKLTMAFPKYTKGEMRYVIAPLFGRIEMPRGEVRRTGRVCIKMLRENVEDFFSLAHGYTVHLARITQICKKKRTPRMYIFLSSFRDIGHKEVEYQVLLKFLGVDQQTFEQDNAAMGRSVKENPFRKYNKVRSQILEPSKQEMDAFMASGDIDFSFCYEPLYKAGRVHGNPTHIRFTIVKGALALERDTQTIVRRKILAFVNTMCEWCGDLNRQGLLDLCGEVSAYDIDLFVEYCYKDVRKIVEQQQPDDVAAYAMEMMRRWIKDCNGNAARRWRLECEDKWKRCRADMLRQCTREDSRRIVSSLQLVSWDDVTYTLTISVNTKDDYKWMEQPQVLSGLVKPTLTEHYGKRLKLIYNIRKI
ncbi:MAG: replication initiation protein [Bacteroidaceae bacterium]|nr:replication initiation protein [Bacteroidaceae bacterium]